MQEQAAPGDAIHLAAAEIVADWRTRCEADQRLRPDELDVDPTSLVHAIAEAIDLPVVLDEPLSGKLAEQHAAFVEGLTSLRPAANLLMHLAESIAMALDNALVAAPLARARLRLQTIQGRLIAETGIRILATVDREAARNSVTRLLGKKAFLSDLDAVLESRADRFALLVIYIDIDGLKRVNDTEGHAAGDNMLKGFAAMLTDAVGGDATAYHLSGDEFAVLSRGSEEETTDALRRLQDNMPFSWGLVATPSHPDLGADDLCKLADKRMYEQKEQRKRAADRH